MILLHEIIVNHMQAEGVPCSKPLYRVHSTLQFTQIRHRDRCVSRNVYIDYCGDYISVVKANDEEQQDEEHVTDINLSDPQSLDKLFAEIRQLIK